MNNELDDEAPDIEQLARDQTRTYIGRKFCSHDLARLVSLVLEAQGYRTQLAPEGADGGIDIVAGRGSMGFDSPRLCVQVKSSSDPIDAKPLRELQGVMTSCGAELGLLVSWGGFKSTVLKEARHLFFKVRLWDADDLVENLLEHYSNLPKELQSELPLKRIWMVADDSD